MASKTWVVLVVVLVAVLLVSYEVAAREVAEKQEKKDNDAGIVDQKYRGDQGAGMTTFRAGMTALSAIDKCCGSGCSGPRCRCCATADEIPDAEYMSGLRN